MHFRENVKMYYVRELQQCFWAAGWGGILILTWAIFFRSAQPATLERGLALPFMVFGFIFGIGGLIAGVRVRRIMPDRLRLVNTDRAAFFSQEVVKVQGTHKAWPRIRIFWGILTINGIGLLFIKSGAYWTGVAIGTLLLSVSGHIEETISMRFNERYYKQVLTEARK